VEHLYDCYYPPTCIISYDENGNPNGNGNTNYSCTESGISTNSSCKTGYGERPANRPFWRE